MKGRVKLNNDVTELEYLIIKRKRKRISQKQISEAIEISQTYLSFLETGKAPFPANGETWNKYKSYIENYGE